MFIYDLSVNSKQGVLYISRDIFFINRAGLQGYVFNKHEFFKWK